MLENLKPEAILAVVIAALGAAWKGVTMFFSLQRRVEANEVMIRDHIDTCPARIAALHECIDKVSEDSRDRHNDVVERVTRVDDKIDRLIHHLTDK